MPIETTASPLTAIPAPLQAKLPWRTPVLRMAVLPAADFQTGNGAADTMFSDNSGS